MNAATAVAGTDKNTAPPPPQMGTLPNEKPIREPVYLPKETYENIHRCSQWDYRELCHDRYGYKAYELEARFNRVIGDIERVGDMKIDNRKIIVEIRRKGRHGKWLPLALSVLKMDESVRSLLIEDAGTDFLSLPDITDAK